MDVIASSTLLHVLEKRVFFGAMAKILDAKSMVYDTGLKE
jgi:hypothetical protein